MTIKLSKLRDALREMKAYKTGDNISEESLAFFLSLPNSEINISVDEYFNDIQQQLTMVLLAEMGASRVRIVREDY